MSTVVWEMVEGRGRDDLIALDPSRRKLRPLTECSRPTFRSVIPIDETFSNRKTSERRTRRGQGEGKGGGGGKASTDIAFLDLVAMVREREFKLLGEL